MTKILVTGGCGFIGSNFIKMIHNETKWDIVNIDYLTYAGNLNNLKDLANSSRYTFYNDDIANICKYRERYLEGVDYIVNFAAETHVDRSIEGAEAFIRTNITGTYSILEAIRRYNKNIRLLQVSTDEVYGDVPYPNKSKETDTLYPSSPYSASKASADHLVLSYHKTHKLDVAVSRCTNNYGPYQHKEKFIPLFITNALQNKPLPLYDGGIQIRDWLHVSDHCRALIAILKRGQSGEIYNIGSDESKEINNFNVAKKILNYLIKSESLIEFGANTRLGHDQRYSVNSDKIKILGWNPIINFELGLKSTIDWYSNNV